MNPRSALNLLKEALGLKYVPRIGWRLRGLTDVESVADHTWGVALVALALARGIEGSLDPTKVLTIALLHDLPERTLSDIPSPALDHLPPSAKRQAEESILAEMLSALPDTARLQGWWMEFEEASSPEGQLVRDADRLEMLIQARLYEEDRAGQLEDFWENQEGRRFFFPISQAIYEELLTARSNPATSNRDPEMDRG